MKQYLIVERLFGRGMRPSQVARLPTETLSAAAVARLPQDDAACTICLSTFAEGDEVTALPCFHRFHKSCIAEWLKRKAECPLCKTDVGRSMN